MNQYKIPSARIFAYHEPSAKALLAVTKLVPVAERAAGARKGVYAVVVSATKDFLLKVSQQVEEIRRFAPNDLLILIPR